MIEVNGKEHDHADLQLSINLQHYPVTIFSFTFILSTKIHSSDLIKSEQIQTNKSDVHLGKNEL